ncbi:uncharacterized protein MONOS_8841 [Monocercomonoides exilis]|uniref:uncharacterized protein n=1 Tax=Monocercomonoides exilis TaxID=2049356 RepID=UPI00355A3736|nr:hypothetical protein MONOS_8841 [Monocercomonoides exilis]|eukprot:MONOS_8841.1-p1 / transcript=MONOS_8841.1 / gene=MONOS_8841 / organism=Monocercomonoides_exilis_PA203 / gene_product=unspecified product / transcript_product=unspecified product / location=Mono_scaffold00345:8071-8776(-) / protein_length=191 / sequence_SO=supercontig / SO=protein_coding / is_pseudo=false
MTKMMCLQDDAIQKIQKMNITEKFNVLFDELGHCSEIEQKQKIEEIREIMDEMDEDEIKSIFTTDNFDKIGKMIEEKDMALDRAILLIKQIGYYKALTGAWSDHYYYFELSKIFEEMIVEEDEKKEEKNERLLVDLCECHLITSKCFIPDNVIVICMLHLLKAASNKKENEETQKEVEMALWLRAIFGIG